MTTKPIFQEIDTNKLHNTGSYFFKLGKNRQKLALRRTRTKKTLNY